ncbi:MAG: O-antigen ligase family protein [Bacteroidetes bacterium]|nr:O-antigen ligase family protein [Bacteroidota bacterium]
MVTLIFILAELLSFSRAGWLSLIVCFLFYVLLKLNLKFKHFFWGVATLLILLFIFKDVLLDKAKTNTYQSDTQKVGEHLLSSGNLNTNVSNLERWNRWKCAIRMFRDRPITGFGPGTYQFVYGPYQLPSEMTRISSMTGNRGNAHSDPLTSLSETGLPGFVLFLLWIFATIRYGFKAYYQTTDLLIKNMVLAALLGFVTFIFHGFFNSFIDQVKLAGLVFGSMAIIVAADMALKSKPVYNDKKEIN